MAMFMIAVIKENNKMVKARVIDTALKEMADMEVQCIIAGILDGKKIENLTVVNGELKGVGGAIERYGVLGVSQSITIIGVIEIQDVGINIYKIADTKGKISMVSEKNLIALSNSCTIANGKVVERSGRKYISSIEGDFVRIPTDYDKYIKDRVLEQLHSCENYEIIGNGIAITYTPVCDAMGNKKYYEMGRLDIAKKKYIKVSDIDFYTKRHSHLGSHVIAVKKHGVYDDYITVYRFKGGNLIEFKNIPSKSEVYSLFACSGYNCIMIAWGDGTYVKEMVVIDMTNNRIGEAVDIYGMIKSIKGEREALVIREVWGRISIGSNKLVPEFSITGAELTATKIKCTFNCIYKSNKKGGTKSIDSGYTLTYISYSDTRPAGCLIIKNTNKNLKIKAETNWLEDFE